MISVMNLSFSHATFDALLIHGFKFVFYACNGVHQKNERLTNSMKSWYLCHLAMRETDQAYQTIIHQR
ncbi:hypothetical protein HYN46_02230 [Aquirhabdus parva]|uniref:Uncharacterized protein n=1 Tax=Aquirhabdus parva TaxID=2283318 RepID=A0A345P3E1_9GAMM|nr:hypothetical protein HYN46_02230 [Aquirhabdus parva]